VERARDELLASAALARDENGQRVTRKPANLVRQSSHRDRGSSDPFERWAGGRFDQIITGLNDERGAPDGDDRSRLAPCLGHASGADMGPVAGPEVFDGDPTAENCEGAVARAYGCVADRDVRVGRSADDGFVARQTDPPGLAFVLNLDEPLRSRHDGRDLDRDRRGGHGLALHVVHATPSDRPQRRLPEMSGPISRRRYRAPCADRSTAR